VFEVLFAPRDESGPIFAGEKKDATGGFYDLARRRGLSHEDATRWAMERVQGRRRKQRVSEAR
jgi:hypothetical protein